MSARLGKNTGRRGKILSKKRSEHCGEGGRKKEARVYVYYAPFP